MGRIRNSPKKDPLSRKSGGGILTAAEKRQRMLEAGKRFVMKSVHRLSPARISSKVNKHTMNFKSSLLQKENSNVAKPASSKLKNYSEVKTPTRISVPALLSTTRERSGYQSCEEELFKRDENSVCDILNHRPISRSAGRPSQLRQNRPSFFPNGINPVDKALSELAPPRKPPRTFKEKNLTALINEETEVITGEGVMFQKLPASSVRKTPGKSVRFAENIVWKSPTKLNENNSSFAKDWAQITENANEAQLQEFFLALSEQSFQRLLAAAIRFGDRGFGERMKLPIFHSQITKYGLAAEKRASNEEEGNIKSSVAITKKFVLSPCASNIMCSTVCDVQTSEQNQMTNLEVTPTISRFPYNLRNSPAC